VPKFSVTNYLHPKPNAIRATYFLGGQAVALHVTGGSPQDGTYYILSDHLGRASTLVKNAAVVSQQRFLPLRQAQGRLLARHGRGKTVATGGFGRSPVYWYSRALWWVTDHTD
jgi:hypothetical protein